MKAQTFRCEVLVKGRWVVASEGWSRVERDAYLNRNNRGDVRFIQE